MPQLQCSVKSCKSCIQCVSPIPVELAHFAAELVPTVSVSKRPCPTTAQRNAQDVLTSELTSYLALRESPSTATTPSAHSEQQQQQLITQATANEERACIAGASRRQQAATACEQVAYFVGSSLPNMIASTLHHEAELCAPHCLSNAGTPKTSEVAPTNWDGDAANSIKCHLQSAVSRHTAGTATPESTTQETTTEHHELHRPFSETLSITTMHIAPR